MYRYLYIVIIGLLIVLHSSACLASEEWVWPQALPIEVGLDKGKLNKSHNRIKRGKYHQIDSMLVIRNGKLVHEKYYNEGKKSRPHSLASAGKSIFSALIGILIDKKVIKSVDERIYDSFVQYYGDFAQWDENKSTITLHNLLTMRAGWDCHIFHEKSRCGRLMNKSRDYHEAIKWVLDRPMKYQPGKVMQYTDAVIPVITTWLYLINSQTSEQMYQQYLFEPLGISTKYQGALTSREMAMFGQLFLNKGSWQGKQIISEDWVNKSTSAIYPIKTKKAGSARGYGYMWWTTKFKSKSDDLAVTGYYAGGNGSQYIVVIPELDIVTIFTGSNYNQYKRMVKVLTIVEDYILPAVIR